MEDGIQRGASPEPQVEHLKIDLKLKGVELITLFDGIDMTDSNLSLERLAVIIGIEFQAIKEGLQEAWNRKPSA